MTRMISALFLVVVALLAPMFTPSERSRDGDEWLSEAQISELVDSIPPPTNPTDEIDRIVAMQSRATPQDERRIFEESFISVFTFSDCVSPDCSAETEEQIAKLFARIDEETTRVIERAQQTFHRCAPDSPAIQKFQPGIEDVGTYPAANIVRARVFARMLAEKFPEKREQLLRASERIANDSVLAGAQFPADVQPSIAVGDAIADGLLKSSDIHDELVIAGRVK